MGKRVYTVHRPLRKHYKMKKVVVSGVNWQLQADLIDMQSWAKENDGYKWIMLAVDCFSRYAYVRFTHSKHGYNTTPAMESIIEEAESRIDRPIRKLQTDDGREFYNQQMNQMLTDRHVKLFSTSSSTKAQMAERLIQTLRRKQERFNTYKGSRRWLDSFPKIVKSYNMTPHSALPNEMTPQDVTLANENALWKHLYGEEMLTTPPSLQRKLRALKKGKGVPMQFSSPKVLNVGDPVRLSKLKQVFEKSIYQNYTEAVYFVARVSEGSKPVTYRVADHNGEMLEGLFYREELSPVRFTDDAGKIKKGKLYAVEEVLKEKVRADGKLWLFVKWRGYSKNENQWIRADQVGKIQDAS
jgi:hypothetical protein